MVFIERKLLWGFQASSSVVSSMPPSGSSIISLDAVGFRLLTAAMSYTDEGHDDGYNGDAYAITCTGVHLYARGSKRAGQAVLR